MARIEALFYLVVAVTGAVVLLCLGSMLFYLSKRVFTPLQQLTRVGNYADGDIQKTLRAVAEDYRSLAHSQDQLWKEREHLVPLALGRSLVRLSEREKGEPAYTQADSCLWMAGIAPGEGYALFAVTCVEDAQGFFGPAQGGASASPPSDLFYYLLNNILNDLLFQEHPGTIAVLPGGWYAVLTACADEGQAQAVTAVSQRLPGVYAEVFSATLLVTDVSWGAGARQFFEDANQLFRKTSFLQFWGSPPSGEEATFEQLSFTNYCRLVRKLTNRLGAQDYADLPEMLDEILLQAASTDAEDVQITKKRIYAMTSILAIAIDEQLSEEREFVDSLHLEERLYGAESIAAFRRELREILSTLIAHREAATAQDPTGRLMEAVRRYLLAHYRETGLNVPSVAQQFHISVSYLSRSFKETQGVNLLEYIQRLRVDAAKKLLVGSSIKAVAQQVGFWDTQGLIRAFKKCEGIGPGEYKKMLENQNDPHALQ